MEEGGCWGCIPAVRWNVKYEIKDLAYQVGGDAGKGILLLEELY